MTTLGQGGVHQVHSKCWYEARINREDLWQEGDSVIKWGQPFVLDCVCADVDECPSALVTQLKEIKARRRRGRRRR